MFDFSSRLFVSYSPQGAEFVGILEQALGTVLKFVCGLGTRNLSLSRDRRALALGKRPDHFSSSPVRRLQTDAALCPTWRFACFDHLPGLSRRLQGGGHSQGAGRCRPGAPRASARQFGQMGPPVERRREAPLGPCPRDAAKAAMGGDR